MQITESIQEIDSSSWVIANHLLLRHSTSGYGELPSWSDGNNGFFMISDLKDTQCVDSQVHALSESSPLRKVYDAGGVSAVWEAGDAFIKVKKVTMPRATEEHVTLSYLQTKATEVDLGFAVPDVLHHSRFSNLYCVILSKLPGKTLSEAWPGMDGTTRQGCMDRVASICQHLSTWKGDKISGVDGQELSDRFLVQRGREKNCDPKNLLNNCKEIGMDCSCLVFYHCDMGPGNIIVGVDGTLGILDWETAGYVPREWVRTKFRVSSGMDLTKGPASERTSWRAGVSRKLESLGFSDVADEWLEWWDS